MADENILSIQEYIDAFSEVGLLTEQNNSIDFSNPIEIDGNLWEPFNLGADAINPIGVYKTFNENLLCI